MTSIIFITFILVVLLSLTTNSVSTKIFNWLSCVAIIFLSFLIMALLWMFIYLILYTDYFDNLNYYPFFYSVYSLNTEYTIFFLDDLYYFYLISPFTPTKFSALTGLNSNPILYFIELNFYIEHVFNSVTLSIIEKIIFILYYFLTLVVNIVRTIIYFFIALFTFY